MRIIGGKSSLFMRIMHAAVAAAMERYDTAPGSNKLLGLLTALPRPFCEGCLRTLFRSG